MPARASCARREDFKKRRAAPLAERQRRTPIVSSARRSFPILLWMRFRNSLIHNDLRLRPCNCAGYEEA